MTWEITDHACSRCFGRVLEREDAGAASAPLRVYRCAECGKSAHGSALAICCCGVPMGGQQGLECVRNPAPSEQVPQEVLVRQRPSEEKAASRPAPARVEVADRGFLV